jgi:large subunit ribosomal protein L21
MKRGRIPYRLRLSRKGSGIRHTRGRVQTVFAVVCQGGKQYRVAKDDRILVESLPDKDGGKVEIKDVLMLCDKGKVTLGSPYVAGASVRAKVVREVKGPKLDTLVFKRRKRSRRRFGHRQRYTELLIEKIEPGAKVPSKKAAAKTGEKETSATRSKKETPKRGA